MTSFTELDSPLAKKLKESLGDCILEMSNPHGDLTLQIDKEQIVRVAQVLRDTPGLDFEQMMDLTAVDYLHQKLPYRFRMVYHFFSLTHKHRVRVKCNLKEDEAEISSIHELWKCVNWYERECYDMYGIQFKGHPDLRRILMYEGFEGHPLRKDYPIEKQQPRIPLLNVAERHEYLNSRHKER